MQLSYMAQGTLHYIDVENVLQIWMEGRTDNDRSAVLKIDKRGWSALLAQAKAAVAQGFVKYEIREAKELPGHEASP